MDKLPKPARLTWFQDIFVFGLARLISRTFMTIFGRAKAYGASNFPKKGGVLILPNHRADVDPLMVQLSCPRNVIFMAKSELFEMKFLAMLMRWGSTFPVKRGEPDRSALRHAAELLKLDEVVCIFPEGQLSETGDLQEIKPGVALVIRLAQCKVICLGIRNTDQVMPYGTTKPHFSRERVTSRWGEARTFSKEDTTEEIVAWITAQLESLTLPVSTKRSLPS